MLDIEGVDYSFDPPSVRLLAQAGKAFAVRYGGVGSRSKRADPAEVAALTSAGVAVVGCVEGNVDGLRLGSAVGKVWSRAAYDDFVSMGMPRNRPVYLSVDFNCSVDEWPSVRTALQAACDEIGPDRVGVYGSYRVMKWAKRDGVARWFWQTYAWSDGAWFTGNHIEQYHNGVKLGGGTVDLCRAKKADYGQWGVERAMAITDEDATLIAKKLLTGDCLPWAPAGYSVGGALHDTTVRVQALIETLNQVATGVSELMTRPFVSPTVPPAVLAEALIAVLGGSLAVEVAGAIVAAESPGLG